MKMKRIIVLLLIVCIAVIPALFSFAACEKKEETGGGDSENAEDAGPAAQSFLKEAATGDRDNYGGSVGYEFECVADITVSAVGRPLNGEMNNSHTIYIWEVSSQTLLAKATVTPDSPLDALAFKTAPLANPIALKAGEKYRIVSSEENGGDKWYDIGTSPDDAPDLLPTADGIITTPVFTGEGEWDSYPSNEYNPGGVKGYVGVTFYYVQAAG